MNVAREAACGWSVELRGMLAELTAARLRWCVVAAGSGYGAGVRCVAPRRSPGSASTVLGAETARPSERPSGSRVKPARGGQRQPIGDGISPKQPCPASVSAPRPPARPARMRSVVAIGDDRGAVGGG